MSVKEDFNDFLPELLNCLVDDDLRSWSIKGFIDSKKNIYTITKDTKVISKIIEIMIFPKILKFAKEYGYKVKLAPYQNYYPDITFINSNGKKFAIDLKSTYRITNDKVNGMTLGAFTGYFRNRESTKNIVYPYNEFEEHYVLGVIYSRTDIESSVEILKNKHLEITDKLKNSLEKYLNEPTEDYWKQVSSHIKETLPICELIDIRSKIDALVVDEFKEFNLHNFTSINSVARNFSLFFQEKWRLATDKPGSGNTKNIGSDKNIINLLEGTGVFFRKFNELGKEKFDLYWKNYLTKDMYKSLDLDKSPYHNLQTFEEWIKSLNTK